LCGVSSAHKSRQELCQGSFSENKLLRFNIWVRKDLLDGDLDQRALGSFTAQLKEKSIRDWKRT
jgi:hypothetical protein